LDQKNLEQDQGRDQVQKEIERTQEKRPIHIQVRDGNFKQRKTQGSFRKVERASIRYWTHGEIFSVAIIHK
jgi:hypothetical protein